MFDAVSKSRVLQGALLALAASRTPLGSLAKAGLDIVAWLGLAAAGPELDGHLAAVEQAWETLGPHTASRALKRAGRAREG